MLLSIFINFSKFISYNVSEAYTITGLIRVMSEFCGLGGRFFLLWKSLVINLSFSFDILTSVDQYLFLFCLYLFYCLKWLVIFIFPYLFSVVFVYECLAFVMIFVLVKDTCRLAISVSSSDCASVPTSIRLLARHLTLIVGFWIQSSHLCRYLPKRFHYFVQNQAE